MNSRRKLDYRSFDEMEADLRRLRGGCSTAGNWSLPQICEHLEEYLAQSMEGFKYRLPWYIRAMGPAILRVVIWRRWIPTGIQAPPALIPQSAEVDCARAVDQLLARIERYRKHTGPLIPNPLFGRLDRERWDQLHLVHCAHHLSFAIPKE